MLEALRRSFLLQTLTLALGLVAVATIIGLVTFWPSGTTLIDPGAQKRQNTERATVEAVERTRCPASASLDCVRATVRLRSGPEEGERASFDVVRTTLDVRLAVGDRIRVYRLDIPEGTEVFGRTIDRYGFSDFDRQRSLLVLTVVFCAFVVLAGRKRGLRALVGLALTLGILIEFVVPAILDGSPAVTVALAGSLAAMFVTIPLAHGLGAKGLPAMLGTAASLGLTALLASLAVDFVQLTGLSSDDTAYLSAVADGVSLQGLLLAGMIIGALGVLDDLTVSQASTVLALRRANPELGTRRLIREGLDVGHDHVAATVNTLVLAYAGASLPVLLIFSIAGTSFGDAVNLEVVAEQIVAMMVGSIGLIAAVPITTSLAALVAMRVPVHALGGDGHVHAH